ncbi:MAG: antibiotic biosynthesis monooxygenase [Myxococcales bacterium]|nr:antibiotic biosynthesis monooxygenase [Myxococcales bacterium]
MIIVAGRVDLSTSNLEEYRKAAIEMISASLHEQGCLDYSFAIDLVDNSVVHFFEKWKTLDDFLAHLNGPNTRNFRKQMARLEIESTDLRIYEVDEERRVGG